VLHFLSHEGVAPIIEIYLRLDAVDEDNVAHILMQQYQFDYF
jgi:hypothetical protein